MLFKPSQADVRRFFCGAYVKWRDQSAMDSMETMAALWIAEHPEYHRDLSDAGSAVEKSYSVDSGRVNVFLHLAMHLSLSEQCGTDQPPGVRTAIGRLATKRGSLHAAHHEAMDALGEMLWRAQRAGESPDGVAYVAALEALATAR